MADETKKTVIIDVQTNANDATQKMGGLKSAVDEVTKAGDKMTGGMLSSFKKLATNPYVAAIGIALGAIVGVFKKLRDAIKNSDDAGTAFARLGAVLKAPLELVNRLVNTIAEGLGRLANAFTDVLLKIMPEKWREQAEAENELVVATDKLEDTERQYAENHARREAKIAELGRNARDSEHRTAVERARDIAEIRRLRRDDFDEQKRIIEEKIRLFKLETRNQISLSDEQKNTLVSLNNELVALQTTYQNSLRETDRLSRQVGDKIIDEWLDVADSHDDATNALNGYFKELLRSEKFDYGKRLDKANVEFGKLADKTLPGLQESANRALNRIGEKVEDFQMALASGGDTEWIKTAANNLLALTDFDLGRAFGKDNIEKAKNLIKGVVDATADYGENVQKIETELQGAEEELEKRWNERQKKRRKDIDSEVDGILQENKKISDAIFQSVLSNYDDIETLTRQYNKQMEGRAEERGKILTKIAKSQSKDEREAYQEQLRLFDEYTSVLTGKYVRDIGKLFAVPLSSKSTNELIESVKSAGIEVSETLGNMSVDFSSMIDEDVDSLAFNLDLMNEKVKEWVNKNAENISLGANAIGAISDILGSASSMIQDDYDAIVSKGDEMTASEIEQAKELAHKQKVIADAQIILNQVMAVGNALVAASAAASQSGVLAPVVFASTLATLTASIVGMIAQLHQNASSYDAKVSELDNIKKQRGYATGGYVEGAGTATSDSIPARLSNGEAVINAKSTSMYYDLLSRINQAGGGVAFPNAQNTPILRFASGGVATNTAQIVEAVKQAVSGIQPVVSVKEITRVQNKLKAKEI